MASFTSAWQRSQNGERLARGHWWCCLDWRLVKQGQSGCSRGSLGQAWADCSLVLVLTPPGFPTLLLCDLGQVIWPLCASGSSCIRWDDDHIPIPHRAVVRIKQHYVREALCTEPDMVTQHMAQPTLNSGYYQQDWQLYHQFEQVTSLPWPLSVNQRYYLLFMGYLETKIRWQWTSRLN